MSRCVPYPALTQAVPHPIWGGVLRLVMGNDPEMVRYLCQMLSLCLSGYTGDKQFWFWQGGTDHGKTTVLTFMARLLGPFVYSIPLKALLKHRQDTSILHDIAGVRGMRLVYAEEFKPGDVLDSSWVKRISGGNDITADRKGEPNVTFSSTAKLIIGTNDMPELTDVDEALRGRVRVVPFPTNIPAVMQAAGKAPYYEVHLQTSGKLQWVMRARGWSTAERLKGGEFRADLRGVNLYQTDLSGTNLGKTSL
jgi:putative DNA primase/helicase